MVAALVAWYVVGYVITFPPTVPQASAAGITNITVQTVASYGHQPHPDWVSYLVKNEQGQWVHSTIWKVPAHSLVRVTVYQYDGDSGLRNPFLGQPRGIVGGTMTVNGKPVPRPRPGRCVAHLHDPRPRRERAAQGRRRRRAEPVRRHALHAAAGAQHDHLRVPHRASPAGYRWQCFVPCAAGWLYGFGGPMQTVGWMDGFLKVV